MFHLITFLIKDIQLILLNYQLENNHQYTQNIPQ